MAGWKASGISDALGTGLAGFSGSFVDPYCEIDPFDQGEVHFNITSEVNCASEKYVEKEEYLLLSMMMMMIMMENSFLGLLAVVMIQKKKMMKRLKTINFSVVFK